MGSADADRVHGSSAAEGDFAGLVDAVVADPTVGIAGGAGRGGLGEQAVDDCRCPTVERRVGAAVVVVVNEAVQE